VPIIENVNFSVISTKEDRGGDETIIKIGTNMEVHMIGTIERLEPNPNNSNAPIPGNVIVGSLVQESTEKSNDGKIQSNTLLKNNIELKNNTESNKILKSDAIKMININHNKILNSKIKNKPISTVVNSNFSKNKMISNNKLNDIINTNIKAKPVSQTSK